MVVGQEEEGGDPASLKALMEEMFSCFLMEPGLQTNGSNAFLYF